MPPNLDQSGGIFGGITEPPATDAPNNMASQSWHLQALNLAQRNQHINVSTCRGQWHVVRIPEDGWAADCGVGSC